MRAFSNTSFAKVFSDITNDLLNNPEFKSKPRDQNVHEIKNAVIEITDPTQNLFTNKHRSTDLRYLKEELKLYFSGRNDKEGFEKASKFWGKLSDDGKTVNSAYGHLIFKELNEHGKTEWQWAYDSLIADKDSRQALVRFNKPIMSYDGNKDFVCTLNAIFSIRDNKLDLTVYRRSQDVHFGLPYDMAWESLMQQNMLLLLKQKYPELTIGTYTLHCHSLHMYERNFDVYKNALQSNFKSESAPLMDTPMVDNIGNLIRHYDINNSQFLTWLYQ